MPRHGVLWPIRTMTFPSPAGHSHVYLSRPPLLTPLFGSIGASLFLFTASLISYSPKTQDSWKCMTASVSNTEAQLRSSELLLPLLPPEGLGKLLGQNQTNSRPALQPACLLSVQDKMFILSQRSLTFQGLMMNLPHFILPLL